MCFPPSEFLGRRQEGDAAGEEPDRGPEEPDEANPEGGQPALGEEGSFLGGDGGVTLQDWGQRCHEADSVFREG